MYASSSKDSRPPLSIRTTRTDRSNSSPTKSLPLPLYSLPPLVDTPTSSRPKARPGGLAAQDVDVSRSRRRSSELALPRRQPSPPRDPGPDQASLSLFAQHCRAFYIDSSTPSGDYISHVLSTAPPSHRATYTKLQAALRSLAHLHHLKLRISIFHALISSTHASGSLSVASRTLLHGYNAQSERKAKLSNFLQTWYGPGTEPFMKGLYSVLGLANKGGEKRVVWEIDDAVFLESGGIEFMQAVVILLKGVLGFDDTPLTAPPQLKRIRTLPKAFAQHRQPTLPKIRQSSRPIAPPPPVTEESDDDPTEDDIIVEEAELNRPRFRLWTFPAHLTDQEADSLQRVFTRGLPQPRFPYVPPGHGSDSAQTSEDWEQVMPGVRVPRPATEALEGVVRLGTGRAWVSHETRDEGFKGSKWFRFKRWWRELFGFT